MAVSFGDNVRILATSATDAAGITGLSGCIYGETVPTASGVEVLGGLADDYAANVFVEELRRAFGWILRLWSLLATELARRSLLRDRRLRLFGNRMVRGPRAILLASLGGASGRAPNNSFEPTPLRGSA